MNKVKVIQSNIKSNLLSYKLMFLFMISNLNVESMNNDNYNKISFINGEVTVDRKNTDKFNNLQKQNFNNSCVSQTPKPNYTNQNKDIQDEEINVSESYNNKSSIWEGSIDDLKITCEALIKKNRSLIIKFESIIYSKGITSMYAPYTHSDAEFLKNRLTPYISGMKITNNSLYFEKGDVEKFLEDKLKSIEEIKDIQNLKNIFQDNYDIIYKRAEDILDEASQNLKEGDNLLTSINEFKDEFGRGAIERVNSEGFLSSEEGEENKIAAEDKIATEEKPKVAENKIATEEKALEEKQKETDKIAAEAKIAADKIAAEAKIAAEKIAAEAKALEEEQKEEKQKEAEDKIAQAKDQLGLNKAVAILKSKAEIEQLSFEKSKFFETKTLEERKTKLEEAKFELEKQSSIAANALKSKQEADLKLKQEADLKADQDKKINEFLSKGGKKHLSNEANLYNQIMLDEANFSEILKAYFEEENFKNNKIKIGKTFVEDVIVLNTKELTKKNIKEKNTLIGLINELDTLYIDIKENLKDILNNNAEELDTELKLKKTQLSYRQAAISEKITNNSSTSTFFKEEYVLLENIEYFFKDYFSKESVIDTFKNFSKRKKITTTGRTFIKVLQEIVNKDLELEKMIKSNTNNEGKILIDVEKAINLTENLEYDDSIKIGFDKLYCQDLYAMSIVQENLDKITDFHSDNKFVKDLYEVYDKKILKLNSNITNINQDFYIKELLEKAEMYKYNNSDEIKNNSFLEKLTKNPTKKDDTDTKKKDSKTDDEEEKKRIAEQERSEKIVIIQEAIEKNIEELDEIKESLNEDGITEEDKKAKIKEKTEKEQKLKEEYKKHVKLLNGEEKTKVIAEINTQIKTIEDEIKNIGTGGEEPKEKKIKEEKIKELKEKLLIYQGQINPATTDDSKKTQDKKEEMGTTTKIVIGVAVVGVVGLAISEFAGITNLFGNSEETKVAAA